jgi:O-antigen/teichoic acid export membrane protein
MTLVGDSLGQCVVSRLSRLFAEGHRAKFAAHIRLLLLMASVVGVGGIAIVHLYGSRLLRLIYSPEYAAHSHVFALLTVGAAIHFVASMLTVAITATRNFVVQVPMYVAMAVCTAVGCARWIPAWGLQGAAFAVIGGAVVRLMVAAGVMCHVCGGSS